MSKKKKNIYIYIQVFLMCYIIHLICYSSLHLLVEHFTDHPFDVLYIYKYIYYINDVNLWKKGFMFCFEFQSF